MGRIPSAVLGLVVLVAVSLGAWLAFRSFAGAIRTGGWIAIAAIALLIVAVLAVAYGWDASRRRRRQFETFIAAHTHAVDDDDDDDERTPADPHRIRRQVHELTLDELRAVAIWEHALDEEGVEGQDEATVRPRPDLEVADPGVGLVIARSRFDAADGSSFIGYAYPPGDAGPGLAQPTIVTDDGQVNFWLGVRKDVGPGDLRPQYEILGKTGERLFPIRYRANVRTGGAPLEGTIGGFMWQSLGGDGVRESR